MAQVAASKLSASTQRTGLSHPTTGGGKKLKYECTYKMEPDKKFPSFEAKQVIKDILESHLEDKQYDPETSVSLTKTLADLIKTRVKELGFSRYKVICVVSIGSKDKGTLCAASQCVWNDKFDTYAECTYKNASLYAVGVVYSIYSE